MPKKPRTHFKPFQLDQATRPRRRPNQTFTPRNSHREEFQTCGAPDGCPNIVSIADRPSGFSGPVYCALHRSNSVASSP